MKLRESFKIHKFSWKNSIWITAVHLIALLFCWQYFTWGAFVTFIIIYYVTGMIGITFSFHRMLTHQGFKVSKFTKNFTALLGTLACQGGPISWVGSHRVHHAFSDVKEDPHDSSKGFWHSHIGFIFYRRGDLDSSKEVAHYCPDLAKDKFMWFLENNMILIQFIFGFSILALGGLLGDKPGFDWYSAISFTVWGVFVRLVAVYHATWLVNSATHKWGTRPNNTNDASRNNWWVALISFGEGWHNNHHAQPRSARHGWHWWQLDITWLLIRFLSLFHIVKAVKVNAAPAPVPISVTSKNSIYPTSDKTTN
ncbi:MAG: fatty acid desaturase [Silvanigrellaceae bacterium]|nr:fatty acid desaturase [Silvanigrellaceae bacterium]